MIMWTVLTWALMPYLAVKLGFVGVSLAAAIIATSSIIVMYVIYRLVKVNFIQSLLAPTLASFFMGSALLVITPYLTSLPRIIVTIFAGAFIYSISLYLLQGKQLFLDLKNLIKPNR